MKTGFLLPAAAAVLTACGASDHTPQADAVYLNAKIYTVDAARTWASAMAVTDARLSLSEATQTWLHILATPP